MPAVGVKGLNQKPKQANFVGPLGYYMSVDFPPELSWSLRMDIVVGLYASAQHRRRRRNWNIWKP